jgi:uncharacterized membrane protein YciS (DUF1049 family)
MGMIKWIGIFIVTLALAFVVIVTFSQAPFHQAAPIMLFTYQTKPYPIYLWVAGALLIGLIAGLCVAAYYAIKLNATIFARNQQIKKLNDDIAELKATTIPKPESPLENETE